MKNLFEGVILGSISMNEASSDASSEALQEFSRLSKDGFRFTNQLYEKLSIERGCEASMNVTLLRDVGEGKYEEREQTVYVYTGENAEVR